MTGIDNDVQDEIDRTANLYSATIYETLQDGLDNTVDGDFFSVISPALEGFIDLYKNVNGEDDYQKTYPSQVLINQIITFLDTYFEGIEGSRSGYSYVVTSDEGKILFAVKPDGTINNPQINSMVSDITRIDVLEEDIEDLKEIIGNIDYSRSGYLIAITDSNGKLLGGFTDSGDFKLSSGRLLIGRRAEINEQVNSRSGYSYVVTDNQGIVVLGVKSNGELYIPKLGALQSVIAEMQTQITENATATVFKDELTDSVFNITSGPNIIWYGDSMTAGAGSTGGNNAPNLLAQKSGLTVINSGVGGETSNTICARSGAIPFPVRIHDSVETKEIPATGEVQIQFDDYLGNGFDPLRQGNGGATGFAGVLNGVAGTIYFTGTGTIAGDYFFVRDEDGSAVAMDRPPYPYRTNFSDLHRGDIYVIWIGQNGNSEEDVLVHVQYMIDHMTALNKKFLIIPKPSSTDLIDEEFERRWGRNVVKVRDYLAKPIYDTDGVTIISSYGLDDAGITPTAQDITDIGQGKVPTSLRVDSVHFNNAGYEITAELVYQRAIELKLI